MLLAIAEWLYRIWTYPAKTGGEKEEVLATGRWISRCAACTLVCRRQNDNVSKYCCLRSGRSDAKFDQTVGHIEDIIVSQEFQDLQNEFMERNYHHFEDVEENKLVYTDVFREYVRSQADHWVIGLTWTYWCLFLSDGASWEVHRGWTEEEIKGLSIGKVSKGTWVRQKLQYLFV